MVCGLEMVANIQAEILHLKSLVRLTAAVAAPGKVGSLRPLFKGSQQPTAQETSTLPYFHGCYTMTPYKAGCMAISSLRRATFKWPERLFHVKAIVKFYIDGF